MAVSEALKVEESFEPLRKKMVCLITRLHKSTNAAEDFKACRKRLNLQSRKSLINDVDTRWNSVHAMLVRFIELKEAVILFQNSESGKDFFFSAEEWQLAEDVTELLLPAYETTTSLSGERYMTGSVVIPTVTMLKKWYTQRAREHERTSGKEAFTTKFANAMCTCLNIYFSNVESVNNRPTVLALGTLCDPRFKKLAFQDKAAACHAVEKLKGEILKLSAAAGNDPAADPPPVPQSTPPPKKKLSLWNDFDLLSKNVNKDRKHESASALQEVVKYLYTATIDRDANPLDWWNTVGKNHYPTIYQVARKYLVVPATSVPSERVFSAAGSIITSKRASLADDTASTLIFLRENAK